MHHLVADSDWSDAALLRAVTEQVLPALTRTDAAPYYWIIDDTGVRKYRLPFGRCGASILWSPR